jgi:hypothetical protein
VKGRFGYCTQDFSPTGPLIERTTYRKYTLLPFTWYTYNVIINTFLFKGCDRMVVGFTTTYANSAYHHKRCEFESRSDVLDTALCDTVC